MTESHNTPLSTWPWLNRLAQFQTSIKTNWRWLGRAITVTVIIYIGVLLFVGREQLAQIDWTEYGRLFVFAILIYLASLIPQLFVWLRMLAIHHPIGWVDIYIYMQTVLWRQIPGGAWHWAGRTTLYKATDRMPGRLVMLASFFDWFLLLATAFAVCGIFAFSLDWFWRLLLIGLSLGINIFLAAKWITAVNIHPRNALLEGSLWSTAYAFSWSMGGLLLYILLPHDQVNQALSLAETTVIWAIAGGISSLAIIAPSGLGIREVSLTVLLQPFYPVSFAVIVVVMLRFIFTLSDLIWGSLGWLISGRFLPDNSENSPANPDISD